MEEVIKSLAEETKRNQAMASIASEPVFREDFLRKAALFEQAIRFLEQNRQLWPDFTGG